jgi:hypothetical protein
VGEPGIGAIGQLRGQPAVGTPDRPDVGAIGSGICRERTRPSSTSVRAPSSSSGSRRTDQSPARV